MWYRSNTIFLFRVMLLNIRSAHKSLWHQWQSQLMQGIHLSKTREAKQVDVVLGLCCVPGYLLHWSSIKLNSLPLLPPSPFTSSQLHCLFFHLSFIHGLPPSNFVSPCTSFTPSDQIAMVCCLLCLSTFYQRTYLQHRHLEANTVSLWVCAVSTTQISQYNLSPLGVA